MDIGVVVPTVGRHVIDLGLDTLARVAEDAGADSVWVNDHLLMVEPLRSTYPYTPDGRCNWASDRPQFEALSSCAFIAACTSKVKIGTAVLVLPQRNPLEVAKVVATVDRLSGGRLNLGVGVGWLAEEMQALGYSFADRGARMDEAIDVLRSCWSGRPAAYAGRHLAVPPGIVLEPRPTCPGGPPLLIGGMTGPARRRAALKGDGWLAVAHAERLPQAELRRALEEIDEQRGAAGLTGSFRRMLEIHCDGDHERILPGAAERAGLLGFDEILFDVPWPRPGHVAVCLGAVQRAVA